MVACGDAPPAVPSATSALLEKMVDKLAVLNQTHVDRHDQRASHVTRKATAAGSV